MTLTDLVQQHLDLGLPPLFLRLVRVRLHGIKICLSSTYKIQMTQITSRFSQQNKDLYRVLYFFCM